MFDPSNYDYLIFDCDGVILDSNLLKSRAFAEALPDEPPEFVKLFVDYHKQHGGISRYEKFKYYFRELCQSTIDITPHQNDIVKFKSDRDEGIKIKYLTIEKYEICKDKDDNIGIEFFNSGKGSCKVKKHDYVTGFPLKELVPEWITEFESLYLVKENNETE